MSLIFTISQEAEPALGPVTAFADRLAEVPASSWRAVGRSLIESPSIHPLREARCAILEATISAQNLTVAAWYARDTIETAAHYASGDTTGWTAADRRTFETAWAAAETTAIALVARQFLPAEDFSALCSPFAELLS